MDAVVDYVFSGSRFKLRIDRENVVIGFGLQGIRVPQPDQNSKISTQLSNEAKNFSKSHLHQRDVQIEVRHMDKKGNFFGQLWIGDKLFASTILGEGLAYIEANENDYLPEYEQLETGEGHAREDSKGVWRTDAALELGLQTGADAAQVFGEEPMKAKIITLDDTRGFFVRFDQDEKKYKDMLAQLQDFANLNEVMQHPVKAGTICVIKDDNESIFHRCRVERSNKNGQYSLYL